MESTSRNPSQIDIRNSCRSSPFRITLLRSGRSSYLRQISCPRQSVSTLIIIFISILIPLVINTAYKLTQGPVDLAEKIVAISSNHEPQLHLQISEIRSERFNAADQQPPAPLPSPHTCTIGSKAVVVLRTDCLETSMLGTNRCHGDCGLNRLKNQRLTRLGPPRCQSSCRKPSTGRMSSYRQRA